MRHKLLFTNGHPEVKADIQVPAREPGFASFHAVALKRRLACGLLTN
jgi:hypothetical protein